MAFSPPWGACCGPRAGVSKRARSHVEAARDELQTRAGHLPAPAASGVGGHGALPLRGDPGVEVVAPVEDAPAEAEAAGTGAPGAANSAGWPRGCAAPRRPR